MVFESGVKNIQAAAYNGKRTVYKICIFYSEQKGNQFLLKGSHGST